MSLDGVFLNQVSHEILAAADDARIDRIAQPAREELILHLRWRGGSGKLLLSASAGSARIHFTEHAPENPKTPPMFCMLLRKHLGGARLLDIRQEGLDRILYLDFESRNELGDAVVLTIVLEIMGRHSNLILVNSDGKIVDSIKRIDFGTSSVRQVLPGLRYELPPMQDKLLLTEIHAGEIIKRLRAGKDAELSKAIMDNLQGMSPLPCREIAYFATRGRDLTVSQLGQEQEERLCFFLECLSRDLRGHTAEPVMLLEPDGCPRDFSFMQIAQYGTAMLTRTYDSYSKLLDAFYTRRDDMERLKQRSSDLLKLLSNASDRITRKIAAQQEELKASEGRERLRVMGDIITANLRQIRKGDKKLAAQNFYDPEGAEIEVPLDIRLTPSQNAQRYYIQYKKADTAEKMLHKLMEQGKEEYAYIETVFDALTRAVSLGDMDAIREELAEGGYVRRMSVKRGAKQERLPPLQYRSKDGFLILTGRNNLQNDRLTLKESNGNDIWLHTQKIPGSHTIIRSEGKEVPDTTIEQACIIAAYHSGARESAKVPVDYTQVRYVKKPSGAKPGMVIYSQFKTVVVDPDEQLAEKLRV